MSNVRGGSLVSYFRFTLILGSLVPEEIHYYFPPRPVSTSVHSHCNRNDLRRLVLLVSLESRSISWSLQCTLVLGGLTRLPMLIESWCRLEFSP